MSTTPTRPVPPTLYIEGPAFWTPTLPGWDAARAAFRGEGALTDPPAKRPSPQVLAPAERRRAPDTVALALEVAAAAMAASGRNAADVPCVFVSAHGDLSINDYMCSTLATDPTVLSPTRFHNSVHNAAVGYWTIGTGCMAASNSVSAFEHSFATGLLEAAVQCAADHSPVLVVGYDTPTVGALTSVTDSRGLLAVAMVLAPERSDRSVAALDWSMVAGNGSKGGEAAPADTPPRSQAAQSLARINPMAQALGLFESLAHLDDGAGPSPVSLQLSPTLSLRLQLRPLSRS
ncbi:beta-ketoacyl synthase chain length factor [Variovorax sp. ZS18.2.2]|uniref:beta-ketoacyl synthase chain length factor n=1 Tax=Variovorax sp. ZS18.2.2 TaxID=2971255 RepID=UPI002150846E|nr:beta-ketoacyl synthase chain length factor [Variovorax sp. ZS18.2.2]MCR6480360.1 beta-ketoacyl synthase chain length factor [Variovorax sp. ZS18.2.2]